MFREVRVATSSYKLEERMAFHPQWVNVNHIQRAYIAAGFFVIQIHGQSLSVHPEDVRPLLKEMGFERVPLKGRVHGL